MKEKLLTIYLTSYNRAFYLEKMLKSVLAQTYKDFDLIILDNASTDNTVEVVNSFDDDRITLIHRPQNIGAIANGNDAFSSAKTKYFMVCHDDDIFEPDMVEMEISYLENHPDVTIVGVAPLYIDENDNPICTWRRTEKTTFDGFLYEKGEYFTNKFTSQTCGVVCPSAMYRTEFFRTNNLVSRLEAGPACDFVMYNEVCLRGGKIFVIDNALINYRIHSGQDSVRLYSKLDLRDLDTIFALNKQYGNVIKKQAFSIAASDKVAFRAAKTAINKLPKANFYLDKKEVESREYFCGYTLKQKLIIFGAIKLSAIFRLLEKIRKHFKRLKK